MMWKVMETAPKDDYFLAWCPDMLTPISNKKLAVCVCWWEKNMSNGAGAWWGDGDYELHPTKWMPMPELPRC